MPLSCNLCLKNGTYTPIFAGVDISSRRTRMEKNGRTDLGKQINSFVNAPNATCDNIWLSWPAMQERAITRGTFVVFDVIASVGNLFLTFGTLMKVIAPPQ